MSDPVRVMTWNVQGSHGLDVTAVAAVIRAAAVDVIALQEIQRRQAGRLAAALSIGARRWVLKHWPLVHRAEGLAVLTPHRLVHAEPFVLRRGWFWRWQRRVGLDATIDAGAAGVVRVLDVHLSPRHHDDHPRREAQLISFRASVSAPEPVIAGDLNELPGNGAVAELTAAGWVDAWVERRGDAPGATNWTGGRRVGRPPTQRIDYVLAPPGVAVEDAVVIDRLAGAVDDPDGMGGLSDHLPLVMALRLPTDDVR